MNSEQILAENARLRKALEAIRDFPKPGNPRRTEDGYPAEIAYDEFAYRRVVDSYRDAARAALSPPPEQTTEDGWIEWKGGECPVADVTVDVRLRDTTTREAKAALYCDWKHVGPDHPDGDSDIFAYRVQP